MKIYKITEASEYLGILDTLKQFRDDESGQKSGGKYPDPLFKPPGFPFPVESLRVLLARLDALLVRRYFRTERLGVGCVRC